MYKERTDSQKFLPAYVSRLICKLSRNYASNENPAGFVDIFTKEISRRKIPMLERPKNLQSR